MRTKIHGSTTNSTQQTNDSEVSMEIVVIILGSLLVSTVILEESKNYNDVDLPMKEATHLILALLQSEFFLERLALLHRLLFLLLLLLLGTKKMNIIGNEGEINQEGKEGSIALPCGLLLRLRLPTTKSLATTRETFKLSHTGPQLCLSCHPWQRRPRRTWPKCQSIAFRFSAHQYEHQCRGGQAKGSPREIPS